MFKKTLERIETNIAIILNKINNTPDDLYKLNSDIRNKEYTIKGLTDSLNAQAKVIDQLYNDKFGETNTDYDTVVLIPYRGKPHVFKDGQRINMDKANSLSVNWSTDSRTEVNVYNE